MSINAKESLQGVVTTQQTLKGNVSTALNLIGSMNVGGAFLPEYYEGEYEVIPSIEEQVLETNRKYMKDDVTVKEIPYAEVTNLANGITVTIGGI